MKTRFLLWSLTAVVLSAAALFHIRASGQQAQLEAAALRERTAALETQRQISASEEKSAALRKQIAARTTERDRANSSATKSTDNVAAATSPASTSASAIPGTTNGNAPASSTAPAPASNAAPALVLSAELRQMQAQAYVSEQRLRLAALLKRQNFDATQLREFDRILTDYQLSLLDETRVTAADREQALKLRDERLRPLFGSAFDQWTAATQNEPARLLVSQLVQQTFQSSGALTTDQASQLTNIVQARRTPASKDPTAPRYDWDAILADARPLLAPRQLEDLTTALRLRRTNEQMSAMAKKK